MESVQPSQSGCTKRSPGANVDVSAVPPRPVTVASDAPTLALANEGVMKAPYLAPQSSRATPR